MAPLRRRNSSFRFAASVPLNPDGITEVRFRLPSAPWRIRSVQPTISRVFKKRPVSLRRLKRSVLQKEAEADSESDDEIYASDGTLPALAMDVDRSPSPVASASAATSTEFANIDLNNPPRPISRKGKDRELVLYPSVPSGVHDRKSPAPTSASTARLTRTLSRASISEESRGSSVAPPESRGRTLWTRWGEKDGEPIFVRRNPGKGITAWWEAFSTAPLRVPPDLSNKRDLALGDVFCNHIPGTESPKLWVWASSKHQSPHWKSLAEGDAREDGKRLYITPKRQDPSWVEAEWCYKQILKRQRTTGE
ncbi:hypothetical protein TRAPUB_6893 [Trametes pubescens]|uniref:Uncharacterized protein n=1 Tax=Trametes pubescens TaxID=154538 RepID=A0A1M2V4R3_TRAPU|nr:hypothetical protein TRAPUB_6893 [Trametes pubescens]